MKKNWRVGLLTVVALAMLSLAACGGVEGGLPPRIEVYSARAQGAAEYGVREGPAVCQYMTTIKLGDLMAVTMITREGRMFVPMSGVDPDQPDLRIGQVKVEGKGECASMLAEIQVVNTETAVSTQYECEEENGRTKCEKMESVGKEGRN